MTPTIAIFAQYFGHYSVFLILVQATKWKFCPHQYVCFSPSEFPTTVAHDLPFARITFALLGCRHVI